MDSASVNIAFLWNRLSPHLKHLSHSDRKRVHSALVVAFCAHEGQLRKSGEPFITHPVEVTRMLGDLHLDADTIVSGLLHDTVEDTDRLTLEEIEFRFGTHVRLIVEAETRLTKLVPTGPGESVKDLDFRHFFACISKDVRIVLVKLADRLHNMRTMESMKPAKQKEKAAETLQVYAPLAGVLGLDSMKEEMEELSLRYRDPERYSELKDHLKRLESAQQASLKAARETLQERLESDSLLSSQVASVIISIRQKSVYSLYKEYQQSGWKLQGNQRLHHVAQLHVELDMKEAKKPGEDAATVCYYVMGLVHLLWSPIPGTMKDYIATPKLTSWKGILTTVWPSSVARLITPVDVLIQTKQMATGSISKLSSLQFPSLVNGEDSSLSDSNGGTDDEGWNFRNLFYEWFKSLQGTSLRNGHSKSDALSNRENGDSHVEPGDVGWNGLNQAQMWVESLKKWQEEVGSDISPRDYVDCIRDDFLSPSVYVFTPVGELVQLPKGATVLDFAYHVHTDIGNRAVGARVDGASVGPGYVLQNAQVVEISTMHPTMSHEYLNILRSRLPAIQTTSARRKLKIFLKQYAKEIKNKLPEIREGLEGLVQPEVYFWVMIYCEDRRGALADISSTISGLGLNISMHRGHQKSDGTCVLKYHVHDADGSCAPELTHELESVKGVTEVVTGCTVPNLSADPRGWHHPKN